MREGRLQVVAEREGWAGTQIRLRHSRQVRTPGGVGGGAVQRAVENCCVSLDYGRVHQHTQNGEGERAEGIREACSTIIHSCPKTGEWTVGRTITACCERVTWQWHT